jgi:hypothetical protein
MPKLIGEKTARVTMPLPKPMVDEVDRIVRTHPQCAWNRQKYVEEAIREKNERTLANDQKPKEVTAPPEPLFCRYCGSKNAKDAIFCQKCGKPIK